MGKGVYKAAGKRNRQHFNGGRTQWSFAVSQKKKKEKDQDKVNLYLNWINLISFCCSPSLILEEEGSKTRKTLTFALNQFDFVRHLRHLAHASSRFAHASSPSFLFLCLCCSWTCPSVDLDLTPSWLIKWDWDVGAKKGRRHQGEPLFKVILFLMCK